MNLLRFLFVHIAETCNLKCQHCFYWKPVTHDTSGNIPVERKMEILQEFAEMNPRGVVVTCGAESTMDLDDFFKFTNRCRELELRCLSVSNGVKVSTLAMAERMILEGPTELSVSLDSHLETYHDELRGIKGSFKAAVRAIQFLVEARKKLCSSSLESNNRIHAMLLLHQGTYLDLEDTYEFALNVLGVDKLKVNMLQPSFGCSSGIDDFFVKNSNMDADKLKAILERCNRRFSLNLNPIWINQMCMYARSVAEAPKNKRGWQHPIKTSEHICNSYDRNIVVDMRGIARLCVSEGYPGRYLTKPGDLRSFWENSEHLREKMRTCNHLCGITHSMRRVSSTFEGEHHFD